MIASVGDVIGCNTRDVTNQASAFKWHLCVCDQAHLHLFVNKRFYPGDYALTNLECEGLKFDSSYVSLAAVKQRGNFPKDSPVACQVSLEYLVGLFEHVKISRKLNEIDKAPVLEGLARKITALSA